MHQGGLTSRYICIWPNVCVNIHEGTHLGHIRSGAIDRHDHHGHRSPFWVRVHFPRGGVERKEKERRNVVQRPGRTEWGGPATGLASSHRQQFGRQGPTSVWPARVKFMLSLGLRARRTLPLIPRIIHSHNSSARRLTRWLPRRSGTLPQAPPLRGARSFAASSIAIALGAGVGFIAYENYQPFRHSVLAVVRCSRVAGE
jgi:hypothetical protein